MNAIASFRKCKLSTPELLEKVDKLTDEMYQEQKVPTRHIPARPDSDYDLLVGELVQRMQEHEKFLNLIEDDLHILLVSDNVNDRLISDLKSRISKYLYRSFGADTPKSAQ